MAKRKTRRRATPAEVAGKRATSRRSGKRPTTKAKPAGNAGGRKATAAKATVRKKAAPKKAARPAPARVVARKGSSSRPATTPKRARLDRQRRTLDETVPTPPSSLNMNRHGSAARTGRAELAESAANHRGMADVAAGDVDVDVENAYFSGDEAPGGDNPTPDQDLVDDIGKALGVQYEDNEELKGADKVIERDKHRWELDPASSEDFKERT